MTVKLRENATLGNVSGSKRRIRLISEGQGSSGFYEAAMLERDGATAFPAGTHIFFDHLTEDEEAQRMGSHSIKDLVGVTLTDAAFESGALFADAKFFPNAIDFINEAVDYIDLSIEAAGKLNEGVVEALHPNPYNAVSIVPRGGRDGKILGLIESYRESGNIDIVETAPIKVQEDARKDKGMTPEEIASLTESLTKAMNATIVTAFGEIKESLVPAPPKEEETEAPSAAEVAEALVVSGLPAEARKRVYESLKNEPDYAKAIEAEKTYVASIAESLGKSADEDDTVIRESKTDKSDYRVGGW